MSKKLKNLCFIALLVTFILSICVIGLINLPTQAYTASATEQTQEESLVSLDVTDKITIEGKNYSSTMAGTNENIRFGLSAGAQIRIVDEETTGIRFSAYLSRADYNTLVDKYGSVELGFRLAKGTDAPTTAKDAPISKYVIMTNKTPDDVSDDVIRFNIVFKKK